ncbi:MAG: response regulator [Candidatus Bathyarchaeota archaeon]|nr:response regulator [Candidatus Bathyarchaeum tardum]WGM88635.1 MAG: response regulator [Candidatus Bathyarchaeum tardum]WNZ29108.1 MAG: response regulator [Candidatus Bathyarchaeota archaeon]
MLYELKVLLVDDNKCTQNVLCKIMQKERCTVTLVENGKDAINELNTKCYDLIVMEMSLPDIKGIDLLKQIVKNNIKIKKIVLTGHPSEEDEEKSFELGVDYYILKPIKPKRLLQIIEKCAITPEN